VDDGTARGDRHAKNLWICGAPRVRKSHLARRQSAVETTTLPKDCDGWWDGTLPPPPSGVIIENFPAGPTDDRLAPELEQWGDSYKFVGRVTVSTVPMDPSRFNLILTSHYPIGHALIAPQKRRQ
jgi:hypothetical protein